MQSDGRSRAVLITGCSSGIGAATARHLARAGWPVYATARRPETLEDLEPLGCAVLRVDVTDEASMQAAVERVEADHGAVGVLVNNAGYGLEGAVEELDLDDVRTQFETNLFGPTRLTQLVIAGMRRQGWGRIVNVSSVGGRLVLPGGAAYHASKHALEALSDALRFELRGFGIDVVIVEPGAIRTRWVDKAVHTLDREQAATDDGSPYAALDTAVQRWLTGAHRGLLRFTAGPPEAVAAAIERAIGSDNPRPRYVIPRVAAAYAAAGHHLPARAWDAFLRLLYPTPGR